MSHVQEMAVELQ